MGLSRRKAPPPSLSPPTRTELPADLLQLGYRSGNHPIDEPLDTEECRTALWMSAGNVTQASKLLKTTSARLGNLVRRNPYLAEERAKAAELAVDRAEAVILEALADDEPARRDDAARFVLTHAGRIRGWARDGATPALNMSFAGASPGGGGISIRWQTAEEAPKVPLTIDHE